MNKGIISLQWWSAKEIYIPKVNPPTAHNISDFYPAPLLNVENFFSLVSRRLEKHLISSNKFINKSVQKGCMEKVPRCWERISMVWAALKEAKSKNLSLATIWFDITSAYGSIPHKRIIFALHRYGVSLKWIHLIQPYYSEILRKSFSQEASSSWHRRKRQTGRENFDAKKTLEDGASNDRLSKLFSISKSEQTGAGAGKRHGDSIEHLYRRDRKSARLLSGR